MNYCIIPARSKSKRIKKKNIKKFINKPIILHTIDKLKKIKNLDLIVVSSDCDQILKIAKNGGADYLIKRPKNISDDKTDTRSVILHSITELEKKFKLNKIFCIYPTSVFLSLKNIQDAVKLEKKRGNFVLSAIKYNHPIQRSFLENNKKIKLNFPEKIASRTQDLKNNYHDAAQFYLASKKNWIRSKSIISNKASFVELSKLEAHDIDELDDWKYAELLFKFKNKTRYKKL